MMRDSNKKNEPIKRRKTNDRVRSEEEEEVDDEQAEDGDRALSRTMANDAIERVKNNSSNWKATSIK